MILYFSGTGNSRYLAERIARASGDTALSLNEKIRAQAYDPLPVGGKLVIVTPTYAWRIPRIVEAWLGKTELQDVCGVWFVMSCGSEIGNAAKYNRLLCARRGWQYRGTKQIVMPENYIAMFKAPEAAEAREIILRAEPELQSACCSIAAGKDFAPPRCLLYDRAMSGIINSFFYSVSVKASPFRVTADCIGCGSCVSLCPLRNIRLSDGRPVWGSSCTHCMACICRCPNAAIEYGRKSVGKPRYTCEKAIQ